MLRPLRLVRPEWGPRIRRGRQAHQGVGRGRGNGAAVPALQVPVEPEAVDGADARGRHQAYGVPVPIDQIYVANSITREELDAIEAKRRESAEESAAEFRKSIARREKRDGTTNTPRPTVCPRKQQNRFLGHV